MPSYWTHKRTASCCSWVPAYEDMSCVVCRYESHLGPADRQAYCLQIGEETYGVVVCLGCNESLWKAARRGWGHDDWEDMDPKMWREENKTEFYALLKQRVMAQWRREAELQKLLYARLEGNNMVDS